MLAEQERQQLAKQENDVLVTEVKQQLPIAPTTNRAALIKELEDYIKDRTVGQNMKQVKGYLYGYSKSRTESRGYNVRLAESLILDLKIFNKNFDQIKNERLIYRFLPNRFRAAEMKKALGKAAIPAHDIHSDKLNSIILEIKKLSKDLDKPAVTIKKKRLY